MDCNCDLDYRCEACIEADEQTARPVIGYRYIQADLDDAYGASSYKAVFA